MEDRGEDRQFGGEVVVGSPQGLNQSSIRQRHVLKGKSSKKTGFKVT